MKLNWGHGIAIFLVCFVSFLAFAVYKAGQNRTFLTEENYYRNDEALKAQIKAEGRSKHLKDTVSFTINQEEIIVKFPNGFNKIKGKIICYKPNDSALDMDFPIKLDTNNEMHILTTKFVKGAWTIKADWKNGDVRYFDSKKVKI